MNFAIKRKHLLIIILILNNDMFISEYYLKDGLVEFKIEKTVHFCLLGKRKIEKTYVVYLKDYLFQPS